ncbi:hypothetical protein ZWY2020_041547 [Hordeum vulgare]|nr:hypothetical protein ZWY2020_041547 [Hordeum vulgare]
MAMELRHRQFFARSGHKSSRRPTVDPASRRRVADPIWIGDPDRQRHVTPLTSPASPALLRAAEWWRGRPKTGAFSIAIASDCGDGLAPRSFAMTLSLDAHLSAAIISSSDGEDRISALPDTLLCNAASHLPLAKDATCTARLKRHPAASTTPTSSIPIDGSNEDDFPCAVEWLATSDKGVEDLTLGNRPFSFDVLVQHPATLLRCGASLRRLYLGVWLFPFTTDLRWPDIFPNLQSSASPRHHGGATSIRVGLQPQAETGAASNYGCPDRVRVGSRSLRCVLLWHSLPDEVAIVSAPSLRCLIIYYTHTSEADGVIKVKIAHAPQLVVLGYLDTATHQLEIGNTIIKAGVTNVCPNTVLPSVKVLALKMHYIANLTCRLTDAEQGAQCAM